MFGSQPPPPPAPPPSTPPPPFKHRDRAGDLNTRHRSPPPLSPAVCETSHSVDLVLHQVNAYLEEQKAEGTQAEEFVRAMGAIPRLQDRLWCWTFTIQFAADMDKLTSKVCLRGGRGGGQGLALRGAGAIGAIPERLQSGRRACESGQRGRLLAVGNAVRAGVGEWECFWGRVRAGVLRGSPPPPPLPQAIPFVLLPRAVVVVCGGVVCARCPRSGAWVPYHKAAGAGL